MVYVIFRKKLTYKRYLINVNRQNIEIVHFNENLPVASKQTNLKNIIGIYYFFDTIFVFSFSQFFFHRHIDQFVEIVP